MLVWNALKKNLQKKALCFLLFFFMLMSEISFANTVSLTQNDIKQLNEIIYLIETKHVEPTEHAKLISGAINGMGLSLDKHSGYLDKELYQQYRSRMHGRYYGIGVDIDNQNGLVQVIGIQDNSPAQQAGIKAGDYILAVNHSPLFDLSLLEAVSKIRGTSTDSASVTLTIASKKDKKKHDIKIARKNIQTKDLSSKVLDQRFGYIHVRDFQVKTKENLIHTISNLEEKTKGHLDGLILDLRNNIGLDLPQGIETADLFIDGNQTKKSNSLGYITLRKTKKQYYASPKDILFNAPLIVIINEGTSSAAEVLASALQTNKRAVILGKKSYGKGSVQEIFPKINNQDDALRLTVGYYHTESGTPIEKRGVTPDVVIDQINLPQEKENLSFIQKIMSKNKKSDAKILSKQDYQLFEALKLLEVMHHLRKNKEILL